MASITLNDLIYRVYENLRATGNSDDDVDIREIANWIQNIRAKYIKQKADKYPLAPIDEAYVQDLGAVQIEIVDSSNHDTLKSFRNMMRSAVSIPSPIETSTGLPLLLRTSPCDLLEQEYNLISYYKAPFIGKGKFNKFETFSCQISDRIYIISNDPSIFEIKYLSVRGVFGNPLEVMAFVNPNQPTEYYYQQNYPINISMAEDLITEATNLWYKFNVTAPKDTIENQSDDLINAPVKQK